MLSLKRVSGTAVPREVIESLQATPHRVECVIEVRTESDGRNKWDRMPVSECTVTLNPPGIPDEVTFRTVAPITMKWQKEGDTYKPVYAYGPDMEVTPWGTWARVSQRVYTPGALDTDPIVVPWGYFMIERVITERNTQEFLGKDALRVLELDARTATSKRRVLANKTDIARRAFDLVDDAWHPGMDPWSTGAFMRHVGTPDKRGASVAKQTDQYDDGRLEVVNALFRRIWQDINSDPTGESIYIVGPKWDPTIDIKPTAPDVRHGRGLVSLRETKDRSGLLNSVTVLWEQKMANRVEQKRTTRTLETVAGADPGKVDVGQRLGTQSREDTGGSDVTTVAKARSRGEDMIKLSLSEATEWEVVMTPLYGLRATDVISVLDQYGNTGRGYVTELTADLTQTSNWTARVTPTNLITAKSFGGSSVITDVDITKWRTVNAPTIDEDCKSLKGWSASGATLSISSASMKIKATSSTVTLRTVAGYTAGNPAVAKVNASFGKVPDTVKIRVTVDGQPGDWVEVLSGRSKTVPSGEQKVTGAFGVKIEITGAKVGAVYSLGGITVEVPA